MARGKWKKSLAALLSATVIMGDAAIVTAAGPEDAPIITEEGQAEENEEIDQPEVISEVTDESDVAEEQDNAQEQESAGGTGEHEMSIDVPSIQDAMGEYGWDYISDLPATFDLREQGKVSSVKNQNPDNTCWAFAALSAAESNLLLKGAAAEPDLSELQFAYFFYNKPTDPLGGTAGDKNVIADQRQDALSNGGNLYTTALTAMEWMGLVDESLMPYTSRESEIPWQDSLAYDQNSTVIRNVDWMSTKDRTILKQYLMEKGAGVISYWYSSRYYNSDTHSYYNPNSTSTGASGHAVTIVGWDDNYPRENFKEAYRPASDGAWLVKNSWGTESDDEGYFWMSYEEERLNISSGVAVFYDAVSVEDSWEHNYQYDGNASLTYDDSFFSGTGMANVFTAQGAEYLEAASVATWNPLQDYTLRVYKNPQKGKPESGELVASQRGTFVTAGYHTVELEQKIYLNKGDTFSVVADFTAGGVNVPLLCAIEDSWAWVRFESQSSEGQSYINRGNGSWTSLGTSGNCRIKAYTSDAEAVDKISLNKSQLYLRPGKTQILTSTMLPSDTGSEVKWTSSNTKVAKVDANGKITAVADGTAKITATAVKGNKTAVCNVKVAAVLKTPALNKPVPTAYNQIQVSWKKTAGADGYRIYRKTATSGYHLWKTVKGKNTVSVKGAAACGKTYIYTVRAYQSFNGKVSLSGYVKKGIKGIAVPVAPRLVKAKYSKGKATVTWKKVAGAKKYYVFRKSGAKGKYVRCGTVYGGNTTVFREKLSKNKNYIYTVRACGVVSGKTVYGKYNTGGIKLK